MNFAAPEHAGTGAGQITCADTDTNQRMMALFIPILRDRLLRPEWGGSVGMDGSGVSLGGLRWQGISLSDALEVLQSIAAAATKAGCVASGVQVWFLHHFCIFNGSLGVRLYRHIFVMNFAFKMMNVVK